MNIDRAWKSFALRFLPPGMFSRLLSACGWIRFMLSRASRSRAGRLLEESLGLKANTPASRRVVRDLFRNRERWSISPAWNQAYERYWSSLRFSQWIGEEHAREAERAGNGMIVLSSHIGGWRALPSVMAEMGYGVDLAYPIQWPFKRRKGTSAISFIRQARRILQNNGRVGLMADGNQGRNSTFTFLGRQIEFATGFAYLSLHTRAPVLPVFLIRTLNGRYDLMFSSIIRPEDYKGDRSQASRAMTAQYLACLESVITTYPDNAPAYFLGARMAPYDVQAGLPA